MKYWIIVFLLFALLGCAGQNGQAGNTGPQGATGVPGSDAHSVTIVQMCPGVPASYPTIFPEVAFCIDGNLYAVYSSLGGFETELTPGIYTSDAVGRSCNFEVRPNCVIVSYP